MPRLVPLLSLAVTTCLAAPAGAADLAGKWRQTRHSVKYDVDAWGGACGAPPRGFSRQPNKVWEATQSGGKVLLKKGRRRKVGTHRCLSENPEIHFRSYDPSSRTTVCSTAPENSKSEKGRYVLKLPDANTLRWTGRTEYDWSFQGTRCTASAREVWTFARVEPVAEEPAPVAKTPEPPPPAPKEPASKVAPKGPGARAPKPRPRQTKGDDLILDLGGGQGTGGAEGLGGLADERHQVGVASSRRLTTLAIAIVLATVAIALFAGAFLLVSRRRRGGGGQGGGASPAGEGPSSSSRSDTGATRMRCPRCGRGFDPLEQYCPYDATPLETHQDPPDSEPALACDEHGPDPAKICPRCTARYGRDKTYCGRDGSELVLLN